MSILAYRSGTWRPMIVSTRDESASSWRPEKASTRELRSSIVTGASSRAPTALATANRSPDGSPPSDSASAGPMSPSARSDAEQRGELGPRRAAAQAEQGDARRPATAASSVGRHRHRRADDQAHGALASDVADAGPASSAARDADAEHERAPAAGTGSSSGSWMTTPPISPSCAGSPRDQLEQGVPEVVEDPSQARTGPLVHRPG